MAGGFRMGPFELMDLVGIDVGFEVAKSFAELSFGEPRWRPSPIQARMVAAGRLGRKTGRGYYEYAEDGSYRPEDPAPPAPGGGDGTLVAIVGDGPVADGLRERARAAGYELREGGPAELVVDAGPRPAAHVPGGAPLLALCAGGSLAARGEPGRGRLRAAAAARLARRADPRAGHPGVRRRGRGGLLRPPRLPRRVGRGRARPRAGRIVCQLVNEAAFAVGEGVGSEEDVDVGMELGLGHPRGPIAWGEAIGLEHVMAVLDGLWAERREERYRPAPLLVRRSATSGIARG